MIVGPRGKVYAAVENDRVEIPPEAHTAAPHAAAPHAAAPVSAAPVGAIVEQEVAGYAVARIDLDEVRRQREELQILQARQPARIARL